MPLHMVTPTSEGVVEEYFWMMFTALVECQGSLTAATVALECMTVTTLVMLE